MTTSGIAHAQTTSDGMRTVFSWFEEMRATSPVSLDEESGTWHVFTYAEANEALSDPASFSSDFTAMLSLNPEVERFCRGNIVTMDPPAMTFRFRPVFRYSTMSAVLQAPSPSRSSAVRSAAHQSSTRLPERARLSRFA